MKVECNLHPEGVSVPVVPVATAVIETMDAGDLIIGVREYGAHPDSEYAIVSLAVDTDGTLQVRVMNGSGSELQPPVEVKS